MNIFSKLTNLYLFSCFVPQENPVTRSHKCVLVRPSRPEDFAVKQVINSHCSTAYYDFTFAGKNGIPNNDLIKSGFLIPPQTIESDFSTSYSEYSFVGKNGIPHNDLNKSGFLTPPKTIESDFSTSHSEYSFVGKNGIPHNDLNKSGFLIQGNSPVPRRVRVMFSPETQEPTPKGYKQNTPRKQLTEHELSARKNKVPQAMGSNPELVGMAIAQDGLTASNGIDVNNLTASTIARLEKPLSPVQQKGIINGFNNQCKIQKITPHISGSNSQVTIKKIMQVIKKPQRPITTLTQENTTSARGKCLTDNNYSSEKISKLAKLVETNGQWDTNDGDLIPLVVFNCSWWPESIALEVNSPQNGSSVLYGKDSLEGKIKLQLHEKHYSYVSSGGEVIQVPGDGDCFYHALMKGFENSKKNIQEGSFIELLNSKELSEKEKITLLRGEVSEQIRSNPALQEKLMPFIA